MPRTKLSVTNLSQTFAVSGGQLAVLDSLSLHVKRGEFVSLIGPSGCGKSTLFNIIAGVLEPTAGRVSIDGRSDGPRLGTSGYLPQKSLLLPWKTVRQNVLLAPTLHGQIPESTRQKADDLLAKFGLSQFADQYPAVLSAGMAQKAALLRTIMSDTDFWLMDEPFGALDAITRLSMQLWLLEIWRDLRATALLITHDIREAILLSDRIYVLSQRPATVLTEITVPLPHPRRKTLLTRPAVLRLETELENLLLPS